METVNLHIKKVLPTDYFADDTFNAILDDIDIKVVGIDHLTSGAHWTIREPDTNYVRKDVVRWPAMKSHQYAECITAGTTSSADTINNYTTGDIVYDGTVVWRIWSLTEQNDNNGGIIKIWLSGYEYKKGDAVLYGKSIYRCIIDHTASSFSTDVSKWQEVYSSIRPFTVSIYYKAGDTVLQGNLIYKCLTDHVSTNFSTDISNWELVGNLVLLHEWETNKLYHEDEIVTHNGQIYRALSDHTSTTDLDTDSSNWELITASIPLWDSDTYYIENAIVHYNNVLYKCIDDHTSGVNFDITKWQLLHDPNAFIRNWYSSTQYYQNQVVRYNGNLYRCNTTNNDATWDITKWTLLTDSINDWVASVDYVVGQYVNYNGALYKCITANNDATFDSSKWQKVSGGLDQWESNFDYSVGDIVINANKIYQCNTAHRSGSTFTPDATKWTEISACITRIPNWTTSTDYVIGDLVSHDAKIYRCTTAHTSDSTQWDSTEESKWEELSPTINEISDWAVSTDYAVGQLVIHNDKLYRCNTAHTSDSTSFNTDIAYWDAISDSGGIETWAANEPYSQGNMVVYNDKIYVCDTAHTSASLFDHTKWHEVSTADIKLWTSNVEYLVGNNVIYNNKLYRCTMAHTSTSTFDVTKWEEISPTKLDDWQTGTDYSVGSLVIHDNQLYRCNTAHTSDTTNFDNDINNWNVIDVKTIINDWASNSLYLQNEVISYDDVLYRSNSNYTSSTNIDLDDSKLDLVYANIRPWASNTYYVAGSIVYYGRCVYKCNTSHTSDEFIKLTTEYNGDGYIRKRRLGDVQWNIDVNDHTFDLGSVCTLEYLDFYHSSNHGEHVNGLVFEVSTDGTTFTNAGSWTYNSSALNSTTRIKFNYTARYVKITSTGFTMYDSTNRDAYISNVKIWSNNSNWDMVSNVPFWSANVIYKNGDFCIYNGYIYKCINTNYDSSFDSSKWEKIGEYRYWTTNTSYSIGDIVIYNDKFYRCVTSHTSSSFNSDHSKWIPTDKNCFIYAWASNTPYYLSEVVSYSGSLYRCIVPNLSTTLEPPTDAIIYASTTSVIDVDDTTTIPYTETIDLYSVYKITDIQYSEVTTDMTFTYTIEISDDNTTFTRWSGDSTDARYIRLTVDSVNIVPGATNPSAYLDNFTVYGDSKSWEKISSGGNGSLDYATNLDIDNLFI